MCNEKTQAAMKTSQYAEVAQSVENVERTASLTAMYNGELCVVGSSPTLCTSVLLYANPFFAVRMQNAIALVQRTPSKGDQQRT